MSRHESIALTDRDSPDRGPAPLAPDFVSDVVNVARGSIGEASAGGLVAAIAVAAVLGATVMLTGISRPSPLPIASASPAAFDPSRFILNALLVPTLDGDAVPLRWVDPRPPSRCGPDTEVRVNHQPLVGGAIVPDTPFELEWQADGCRPFGTNGPRFDGRVRLTVFREEWGLSAIVEPSGLRVSFAGHESTMTQRSGAWLPFVDDAAEPIELTAIGAGS